MLSQPYSTHQQNDYQYHTQDYLSASLPLAQPQSSSTELLTSPFHPSSLDDLYFLNGDPLNDHGMDLFSLASQNDGPSTMNFGSTFGDSSDVLTLDEFTVPSFSISLAQPALSSSLDAFPFQFHMPTNPAQQQQQQHQQNRPSDTTGMKNHLGVPSHKGHRRKRSSSVPPFFHSVKKRIIQSSFTPPSFDNGDVNSNNSNNNNMAYLSQQQPYLSSTVQPMPIAAGSSLSTSIPQSSVLARPQHHQQQQHYGKPLPIQIQRNPAPIHRHPSPVSLDQQQLDEKLLQVDFHDITVAGLKDYLRERSMSVAGRKADLVDRLRNERQRVYAQQQQKKTSAPAVQCPTITSSPSSSSTTATPALSSVVASSPPPSPSTSSISSSPSPHSYKRSSPINQLAHRLGGLGFQHHPTSLPSSSGLANYHPINTITSMPSLPQQQQPFGIHPSIPQEFKLPVESIQQQWISDSSMNHFYRS